MARDDENTNDKAADKPIDHGSDSFISDRPLRAKRYSKSARSDITATPTQLGFYPGQWRDVLEAAKRHFREWLACKNGFPTRRMDLGEARECVAEALAAHQQRGLAVEPGMDMILESAVSNNDLTRILAQTPGGYGCSSKSLGFCCNLYGHAP